MHLGCQTTNRPPLAFPSDYSVVHSSHLSPALFGLAYVALETKEIPKEQRQEVIEVMFEEDCQLATEGQGPFLHLGRET